MSVLIQFKSNRVIQPRPPPRPAPLPADTPTHPPTQTKLARFDRFSISVFTIEFAGRPIDGARGRQQLPAAAAANRWRRHPANPHKEAISNPQTHDDIHNNNSNNINNNYPHRSNELIIY